MRPSSRPFRVPSFGWTMAVRHTTCSFVYITAQQWVCSHSFEIRNSDWMTWVDMEYEPFVNSIASLRCSHFICSRVRVCVWSWRDDSMDEDFRILTIFRLFSPCVSEKERKLRGPPRKGIPVVFLPSLKFLLDFEFYTSCGMNEHEEERHEEINRREKFTLTTVQSGREKSFVHEKSFLQLNYTKG